MLSIQRRVAVLTKVAGTPWDSGAMGVHPATQSALDAGNAKLQKSISAQGAASSPAGKVLATKTRLGQWKPTTTDPIQIAAHAFVGGPKKEVPTREIPKVDIASLPTGSPAVKPAPARPTTDPGVERQIAGIRARQNAATATDWSKSTYAQRMALGKQVGEGSKEYKDAMNKWWSARVVRNKAANPTMASSAPTAFPDEGPSKPATTGYQDRATPSSIRTGIVSGAAKGPERGVNTPLLRGDFPMMSTEERRAKMRAALEASKRSYGAGS